MVIVAECIALIKEVLPHITTQSSKLKQLIELQAQPCVSNEDRIYLDEAIASLVFQQYTGIKTNAKNRKILYEYQKNTGIAWEELQLCYKRLMTEKGQIRQPVRKDLNRPKRIGFFMAIISALICALLWFISGYVNPIFQISIHILQFALVLLTLKVIDLALDITAALTAISKLHYQSEQPTPQIQNIPETTATA